MRRWLRRIARIAAILGCGLVVVTLVTARPGDPSLYPPQPGQPNPEIFVVSHGYHSGIVLPRELVAETASRSGRAALIAISNRFAAYPWIEIGWGDEEFYRTVPTAASLTVALALRALFMPGNSSVLHVVGLSLPPEQAFPSSRLVRVDLGENGFVRLLTKVDKTFALAPDGLSPVDLGAGLYGPSRFFRANGTFNLFKVCNHWVADSLDAAGVPTAPVLASLPQGLFLDLKWRSGIDEEGGQSSVP